MKKYLALAAALFIPFTLIAGELSESDTGTYVVLDQNRAPTDVFYRLSKDQGKWLMEGKKPGSGWANISCDPGCEYRPATDSEIQAYFPPDWRANAQIACIQNIAQAFCSYIPRNDPTRKGYVVIALVTGRPIPIFVRRLPS